MASIIEGAIVYKINYAVIGGEAADGGVIVIDVDDVTTVLRRPPAGKPG
jgi:hypothetical protein